MIRKISHKNLLRNSKKYSHLSSDLLYSIGIGDTLVYKYQTELEKNKLFELPYFIHDGDEKMFFVHNDENKVSWLKWLTLKGGEKMWNDTLLNSLWGFGLTPVMILLFVSFVFRKILKLAVGLLKFVLPILLVTTFYYLLFT